MSGKHRDIRFEPASLYCRLGSGSLDDIGLPKMPAQIKQEDLGATIKVFSNDSLHSVSKRPYEAF